MAMRTMDMWTERMTVFRKKSAQMQASIMAAKSTGILLLFLELMLKEFLVMVLYRRRTEHKSMTILMIAPVVTGI